MSKLTGKSSLFFSFNFLYIYLTNNIHVAAQSTLSFLYHRECESNINNPSYQANLERALASLPDTNSGYGFCNISTGQNADEAYAIALCRGDLTAIKCNRCVNDSIVKLRQYCQDYTDGTGYFDECMVKYSIAVILGSSSVVKPDTWNNSKSVTTNVENFDQDVLNLMGDLTVKAASEGPLRKYAAGADSSSQIYGIVQCTPDLSEEKCTSCLTNAVSSLADCCSGITGGRVFFPTCNLRYDDYRFYDDAVQIPPESAPHQPSPPPSSLPQQSPPPSSLPQQSPPPGTKTPVSTWKKGTHIIIIIALTVAIVIIIAIVCTVVIWRKKRMMPAESSHNKMMSAKSSQNKMLPAESLECCETKMMPIESSESEKMLPVESSEGEKMMFVETSEGGKMMFAESSDANTKDFNIPEFLEYEFDIIRAATNGFSEENKIGQSGFGSVYKGKLDGQLVAVKRLSSHSKHVELEFRTKLVSVAKLQHPNLVRLLGFSLEGEERLVIYEFLGNGCLDKLLLDPNKRKHLDWDTSYKIIQGVAQGLLYLHEDSDQIINHCNLKASNVLLDSNMDPKITDFGMTRLFAPHEIQGNPSSIAKTVGYMPPEYTKHQHGQISVKIDVFSFGVLVLEIIKGQMFQSFRDEDGVNLLSSVWNNWSERTASAMIDSRLLNAPDLIPKITKSIHIALLCVQESNKARPTMSSVVDMLKNASHIPQELSKPGFYDHNEPFKLSQKLAMAA